MKRQLALGLVPALLALASFNAWASDGDIQMLATVSGTGGGHVGDECPFWKIVFNNSSPQGKSPWGVCQPPVIQVYAQLQGASAGGITGVEYGGKYGPTAAADAGYFFIEISAPATTVLGNAWFPPDPSPGGSPQNGGQGRGINMAWNACQTGGGTGRVLLSTLVVIPTAPCGAVAVPPQIDLSTGQHREPSNVFFRCPLFTLCDGPVFTKVCLGDNLTPCATPVPPFPIASTCSSSGFFTINNPSSPGIGACTPPPGKASASAEALASPGTWSSVKSLYR